MSDMLKTLFILHPNLFPNRTTRMTRTILAVRRWVVMSRPRAISPTTTRRTSPWPCGWWWCVRQQQPRHRTC